MQKLILKNNIKLIYEKREGEITSFCIGFDAGASAEKDSEIGLAHLTEHMLFKSTDILNEAQINDTFEELFGFYNAMTNYPYVIYYGTTLTANFKAGFEHYANVVLKPAFPETGFIEEKNIIMSELRDWQEDAGQLCEDILFSNSFKKRRLKHRIIGDENLIKQFSIEDVKNFYKNNYRCDNCVITVITSLELNVVEELIENKLLEFSNNNTVNYSDSSCGDFSPGIHFNERLGLEIVKIQYSFSLEELDEKELNALELFNIYFGEGTNSLLYNKIRTSKGYAYSIYSEVKREKGIKLLNIKLSTSKSDYKNCIFEIDNILNEIHADMHLLDIEKTNKLLKKHEIKRALKLEKTIELCKYLTTEEIMGCNSEMLSEDWAFIINTAKKALLNPAIQILK